MIAIDFVPNGMLGVTFLWNSRQYVARGKFVDGGTELLRSLSGTPVIDLNSVGRDGTLVGECYPATFGPVVLQRIYNAVIRQHDDTLNTIIKGWAHPAYPTMLQFVQTHTKRFQTDFTIYDCYALGEHDPKEPFLWLARDYGSDIWFKFNRVNSNWLDSYRGDSSAVYFYWNGASFRCTTEDHAQAYLVMLPKG